MKKLVIFDLDGTLLNTIADLAAATNQALQYYGYPTHETEAYRFFVGNGINKLFERALPEGERTEENVLKIRSQFIPYYDEHNADLSRPYPGISELLKTLKQEDILYVGDSNVDMQTAHHAGVTAIGVAWGFRPRTELEALHPAHIIEKAEELLPLLLS